MVDNLFLVKTYLIGPLSPSVGTLSRLRALDLSINALSGAIPGELGMLKALESLSVATNNLSGPLPSEFGNLRKLTQLCDLIILANDKKEKIASGLLNPFLAHLKIAQDQVAKGGYSIILEPALGTDSSWFTKATIERFVRFVSTPEILERVYTIETEILQIEEAIAIQSSNDIGQSIVENHQRKSLGGYEGDKSATNANEETAIVLYTPGTPLPDANGSEEGNSRAQLLKVLETRRTALQKEQGMAFARAVAAGFDIDDISPLVSFAECFGAMRLLEACTKFINLWKRKHETGQWLDIDASESLVAQSDFSTINGSGIILSTTPNNHGESNNDPASVNTGKSGSTSNTENPVLNVQQEYIQGQFPQFLFPPWPMHAPPGAQPVFQAYPVQGMPYYPAYAGNGHLFQPPQHAMEHSPPNFDPQSGMRQPLDVMGGSTGQETIEINRTRSLDDTVSNDEVSHGRKSRKDSGGFNKKQSGMVVIRNINYITSKEKKSHSDANSDSCSDVDTVHGSESDDQEVIHHNKHRFSKRGGNHPQSADKLRLSNDDAAVFGISGDNRQWQAFQDCLLKGSDEGIRADNKGLFAMEKSGKIKKLAGGDDPSSSTVDNDSREINGHMDIQFSETGRRKILSRSTHEDFMIGNRQKQGDLSNSLAVNSFEGATTKIGRDSSNRMSDETLVVPFRSMSTGQGTNGTTIDIDSEIPSKYQKLESGGNNKVNYEPNDLSLMPERRNDKRSTGYDLTLDYEMQGYAEGSQGKGKKSVSHGKGGVKKTERDRRSKMNPDSLNKQKTVGLVRKSYPSKLSASEDARARAERLRSYKAELQKMKKEKEDEEQKRLEALKLARQKRIAARGGSLAVKQSTPSPHTKHSLPKLSPATSRGSKFSDLGPGSSSPLQRSKIRNSLVSSEPPKASKASKVKEVTRTSGHRLTRSSSSLSETKREQNSGSDSKASISRIRRLSEPKTISNPLVTTTKPRSSDGVLKRKLFHGPEKNKVSAIIDLDRSKAATLPELKIKTAKSGNSRSAAEEKHKTTGARPSEVPKHAEQHTNSSHTVHHIDAEENPVIEKSVVVLESEKPSFPGSYSSEAKLEIWNQQQNNRPEGEKNGMASESAPLPVPPMNKESMSSQLRKQSDCTEVRASHSERDPPNSLNITKDGNSYQAPHARASSLGDHTHQSNYGKVPLLRTEPLSRAEDKVRTHVPDVKAPHLDKHQLLSEKSSKDSPKGFRRLLKFGKKNHTSSSMDQSFESDCTTGDGIEHGDSAKKASTSQAHTLKNLISHDDNSAASNVGTKSSLPFSLLSPFWSKSSEKKQAS